MHDKSFVTVVINSHGMDLRKEKATARQRTTMRKLTMPGKSGMYSWHGIDNMMSTIFRAAHEMSKNHHVPFTKKLRAFSDHICALGFNERAQKVYETETAKLPNDELLKACKVSTKSDWFLTSQVKYNHLYAFNVNDDSNPWERNNFGIWLVDGSNEVLNSVDFDETKERNNIFSIIKAETNENITKTKENTIVKTPIRCEWKSTFSFRITNHVNHINKFTHNLICNLSIFVFVF
jgi:hypothetical protein